jgi:malonyl-CoA/methylmalonyl-CoA synthetase
MSRFFKKLLQFGRACNKPAIIDGQGAFSYNQLLQSAQTFSEEKLRPHLGSEESGESMKVAYLTDRDATYVTS